MSAIEVDTTPQLTVVSWKRPKISYEYHRAYLIRLCQKKRNEEFMRARTEEFHWVDSPATWLSQARFLLQQIQEHPSWAIETKRTYVNALKQVLRLEYEKKELSEVDQNKLMEAIEETRRGHEQLSMETLRSEKDNTLRNDGRDLHWMPWKSILSIREGLERRIAQNRIGVYQSHQMLLLLQLYTLQPAPLRLNYGRARLFPSDAETHTLDASGENYVTRKSPGVYHFHLRHDKVVGSRGPITVPLHETICRHIDDLESLYGYRRYLLTRCNSVLEPLDVLNQLKTGSSHLLASIPMPNEDRPSMLNVCTIRSAFATDFLDKGPSENEIETTATAMRTSVAIMRVYYRKIVSHTPLSPIT